MRLIVSQDHVPSVDPLGPLAVIPAGEGVVGSDRPVRRLDGSEYAEYPANGPPRRVRLERPLQMGRHVVTVAAFRAVCSDVFEAAPPVFVLPTSGDVHEPWPTRPFPDVNRAGVLPVVGVTWDEARTFCARVSAALGVRVRLPREDEWEYAARAGSRATYAWGDQPGDSAAHAWTRLNTEKEVQPVGQLAPNAWGLHDVAGNVWEWCADAFRAAREVAAVRRSIRGGGAFNEVTAVRASHRWGLAPGQRNAFLGFRVVVEVGRGSQLLSVVEA